MDGVPLTEFFIEAIIREGLQDLKNDPYKIDMLFARFLSPYLRTQYGQRTIDLLKEYILNDKKEIAVVQAWPLAPEKIPCYSINILNTEEDPSRAFFEDNAGYVQSAMTAAIIVSAFTPNSYDSLTGYISVADGIDLSNVFVGAIFRDGAGVPFTITGPIIDTLGSKRFGIEAGQTVTIGLSVIESPITTQEDPHFETPLIEVVQIGIHAAENTNLCKFLYYLLVYFLQSKRLTMENHSLQIHTFTVSDFIKVPELLPENILNRFVNMRLLTWFGWNARMFYSSPSSSSIGVKVDKDVWIKRGDFSVITTDENGN